MSCQNLYNMDISQFESQSNNALLQIQKAQRILDETESKMKRFKHEKKLASSTKLISQINQQPLTNIRQYLAYFLNEQQQHYQNEAQNIKATTQLKTKKQVSNYFDNDLHNHKRTEKPQMFIKNSKQREKQNFGEKIFAIDEEINIFDMKKHTQQQLEKSQLLHLQRLETFYKQNCDILDKKFKQLESNRQKIRKDKVLLMRDNQQLQEKIQMLRKKKQEHSQTANPHNQIINNLNGEISKLQKKLAQIQMQNNKIIKRKKGLQTNMRVCIRNNKQHLQGNLSNHGLVESKSKSMIASRCPYH